MDEQHFEMLKTALAASPDNSALLGLLLRACRERGALDYALELIRARRPEEFGADRLLAAELSLEGDDAGLALSLAGEDSPEALLLRARALAALGRNEDGAQAYDQAVSQNPALEDRELRARLAARVRVLPERDGRPRLTVISNDDTDDSEIARLLEPARETVSFADVGGLTELKQQVHKRIILPFQKPSLFERFKRRAGGGILMYGPPGCGKTLLARATAGECKAAFFNVAIADVLDMYIGESERKLHAIFEQARRSAPAVLFFDEMEALGGKRQYSREGTSSKLVSQFLSEMDGFAQANQGVLMLGATNVPWAIDPAFRRPGRFDRVLFVPPPDREARAAILKLLLADRPVTGDIDTAWLAAQTGGYSGADLKAVVESAIDAAIEASITSGREMPVSQAHLKAALRDTRPTTLEWLNTARNYARYANEAGQYDEVLEFLRKHGKE